MLPVPSLAENASMFCFVLILLVPLAWIGVGLLNAGLGRSRSAAHAVLTCLCSGGIAVTTFVIFGYSWQATAANSGHFVSVGTHSWNLLASQPFFLRGSRLDLSAESLIVLLQIFSVALAAIIPLSAGSDRWRLGPACISSALLAGVVYPVFAHWVWGGGWLAQLGTNVGVGRGFVDAGGASTIQITGGLTALSITWILGPRRGKFSPQDMPAGIPGHNAVFALVGCLFAWIGWLGLNTAGAILFAGCQISAVVLIVVNTTLSAVAAALTMSALTKARFGRPDASLCANGWMSGLVASSAAAPFVKPASAIIVGIIAGVIVVYSIDLLEARLTIDDPAGAISVHAVAGVWGLFAVSLLTGAASSGQWLAQLAGVCTLFGFVLPFTYGLNWILDRFYRQRVDEEGEMQGMDLYELGAGAYPEFVTHHDEFLPR
jgi:Amt family ammonium transporter